jgi:hypothetical protein
MKKLLLALLTVAFGTVSVMAQMPTFAVADANADGMVSMEEATSAGITADQFTAADANADGSLNEEEFTAATGG